MAINTRSARMLLETLQHRYNPENDRSPDAAVSWADIQEADILSFVITAIEHLDERISDLEKYLDQAAKG